MSVESTKLLGTLIAVLAAIGIKLIINRVLRKISRKLNFHTARRALINRIINMALVLVASVVIIGIWGLGSDDLVIYFTSIFTVIGIAFFAQWSHLSNITAGVILFFSTSIRVGDTISIGDGDSKKTGLIDNIGLYFVTLITEGDHRVMISNTLFLQNMVTVNPRHNGD